jgi:K+-sensing histidine kinase KdpD
MTIVTASLLVLTIPVMAYAYGIAGNSTIAWQLLAAAVVAFTFNLRRAKAWMREHPSVLTLRPRGFLFASCYALVATPLVCTVFQAKPLPRFNDIFLVGIVLTTYLFTWDAALYLLAVAVLVSAWVLPPYGTLAVDRIEDWYRIASFTVLALFLVVLVNRLKAGSGSRQPEREMVAARSASGGD